MIFRTPSFTMTLSRPLAPLVLALSMSWLLAGCNGQKAESAAAPPAAEVGVVTLKTEPLALMTELAGRTSPYLVADVRPQVGGIIQKRHFTEGGMVKAGEPLYQIDPATYEAAVARAQAALAKAEANLTTARTKAERYGELVSIQAVSQQDNDDAQAAFHAAKAEVLAARAELKTAEIDLYYTRVASPIAGRIGKSSVTPGALVTSNQNTALATVQQLDPIYVDVTQSSAELLRLKRELANGTLAQDEKGRARVSLKLEDGSDYPQEGRLEFADVTVDTNTGTVTLRAVFPNPDATLLPGMYVRAQVQEGINPQALLVPQQGVTRNTKGEPTALVVGKDGKVAQRVLQTQRAIGDKWLVSAGLQAGDKVIVQGLQKVRPGMPVKPVETGSKPAADGQAKPAAAAPAAR